MYSYGSSARAAGGKRGHGGRPYRPPPDRSKKDETPPPLKQCDCLIELDLTEYAQASDTSRTHETFGSRRAMETAVREVRAKFLCHLQIPGRNQGNPVALVASSVEVAIPACHYVIQRIVTQETVTARIHRNVKANLPVIVGTLYKINTKSGQLFRQDSSTIFTAPWAVALYNMTDPVQEMLTLQTCLDNLHFRDSSFEYQLTSHDTTLFAMASQPNIDQLLHEIEQAVRAASASTTGSKEG
eukprot:scaffold15669_cov160-Amphora_coffeaeformis.AAC.2